MKLRKDKESVPILLNYAKTTEKLSVMSKHFIKTGLPYLNEEYTLFELDEIGEIVKKDE